MFDLAHDHVARQAELHQATAAPVSNVVAKVIASMQLPAVVVKLGAPMVGRFPCNGVRIRNPAMALRGQLQSIAQAGEPGETEDDFQSRVRKSLQQDEHSP